MKIYYLSYVSDVGNVEAFTSKRAAQKRLAQMKREQRVSLKPVESDDPWVEAFPAYEKMPEIEWIDFPATKQGLIAALQYGAAAVHK